MATMPFHEASMIFPMLDDDALMSLADDIEKNGQREPCLIAGGKILDGRNRWMACRLRNIKPKVKEIDEPADPVSFVLSLNLHRRHLTPSQASMCAARAKEIYEKQAKERQGKRTDLKNIPANLPECKGDARDQAGKAFGVSGKSVDHAVRVLEKGIPELARAVDSGKMAVSTAAIVANDTPTEQKLAIEKQANRDYSKSAGRKKPEIKVDPIHKHMDTEAFAISKAEVAITQLRGIPKANKFRKQALEMVSNWILKNGK